MRRKERQKSSGEAFDELERLQGETQSLLEELDREPTWKETIPYGAVYIALVLALAWASRFLPDEFLNEWWVDPRLIVDGLLLMVIVGFFLWMKWNDLQFRKQEQKLKQILANKKLHATAQEREAGSGPGAE